MGAMSSAKTTGLMICNTLSPKGLKFIQKNDPELYAEILKRLAKIKGGKSK